MSWLESPEKLLGVALLGVVAGLSVIALGLTLLTAFAG